MHQTARTHRITWHDFLAYLEWIGVDRYPYVVAARFVVAEISASQRMRASSLERIMAPLK
jgi:hypothetical protein